MKYLLKVIKNLSMGMLALTAVLSLFVGVSYAAPGEYPEGTISIVGNSTRSVNVKAGDRIEVEVKMTKSKQLCKVYVLYYKVDGRSPKTTNKLDKALKLEVIRGQSDSYNLKGSLDTTGLPNGAYRAFIYGDQVCDQLNPQGNNDNEFACDGNPSCSAYCGKSQRPVSPDGAPDEPGDLYRTSSNDTYYGTYGTVQCVEDTIKVPGAPQNSCGEVSGGPSCDDSSFATRVGECDIKACDTSGKGFDNFTFVVGSASGGTNPGNGGGATTPGTGGSPGGTTGGGTPPTNPVSTEIALASTNKAGQVKADSLSVDFKGKQLNLSAGVRSTINNEFVDPSLQAKIGGGVTIGTKMVQLTKAVNVLSGAGGLTLSNGVTSVNVSIADGTTVMGTDSWDGKLKFVPIVASDVPVGFKVKGQAVEIGSTTSSLVLSKPALIIFSNAECDWAATNITCDVSYKSVGATSWTNVPKCSAEVAKDTSKLEFAKECYVPNYSKKEVQVWTYHFSEYANFSVDQPVSFLMALPQVCLDKADPNKLLLQFQFGVNPAYGSVIQAFTRCSSRTSCDGPEQLLSDWKSIETGQTIVDSVPVLSSIYGIKTGDVLKFRVGGTLRGGTTPANIADLTDKYWSEPVFKRVSSCENRGNGITIEELIISPQTR